MAQVSITSGGLVQVDDRVSLSLTEPTAIDKLFSEDFDHSDIPLENEEWPVIIMGSSLVGMMTGLLLGFHGIKVISFDRHKSLSAHPRAAGMNFRTCEIFRQIGLEERCKIESVREYDIDAGLLVVDKLIGGKIVKVVQDHDSKQDAEITPTKWLWLTQDMMEPILQEHAPANNYTVSYGKEIVHYDEQTDGVIVVVKDLATNKFKKYKTQYLVACDGNRSATRRKEGIDLQGRGFLGHGLNIRFKADLRRYLGERARYGILYLDRTDIKGGFRQEERGQGGLFYINAAYGRTDFPPGSVSEEDAKKYLQEVSGLSDEVIAFQSFAHWTLASVTAERFLSRGGRVLIAGDAAHIMPPTGALGGNTGCSDAHNLSWKLAYVLSGKAAPTLLQSYELERRPTDAFVVDQATRRYYNRIQGQTPPAPEEPYYTVELGARYKVGAFVSEAENYDKDFEDPHFPSGAAGARFPHVFLVTKDGATISSLDLVKRNFVLVAVEDNSPWIAAAKRLKFGLDTYSLHESSVPYRDDDGKMRTRAKLGSGDALLIRPDHYIAWRAPKLGFEHENRLKSALEQILGRKIN